MPGTTQEHGGLARLTDGHQGPALLDVDGRIMDYRVLRCSAAALRGDLRDAGVAAGDAVAVVLPEGLQMAVVVWAVASAAVCAPLNPAYSSAQLQFYFEDLRAKAVIVPAEGHAVAEAVAARRGLRVLRVQVAGADGTLRLEGNRAGGGAARPGAATPAAVALVLHTSGTTARPKRVPLTQANLLASARHVASSLALGAQDRCLNLMPMFHIHGLVAALLATLGSGGSVVCAPGFREGRLLGWLGALEPTWYSAVPTIHQAVLGELQRGRAGPLPGRLRLVRSSSAALPAPLMRALEEQLGVPVIEAYGMTEAAHQIASNPLPPGVRRPGSVGKPAGPEVAVLGPQGERLAAGEQGEVAIRGPNVTSGYLGLPEVNRQAYSDGWLRTGDLGRLEADGYLYLVGRIKELVNRGGEKVAPALVDAALLADARVHQAVAFAVPHPTLGEDLVAAVVLREGLRVSEQELRAPLFERLAPVQVPSRLLFVEAIPRGPTGKLQRIGLAEALAPALASGYVPPGSPGETRLAEVFAAVLGIERVGATDNFFALGGDSLRGMQALARIRAAWGVALPVTELFRLPVVRALAAELDRLKALADAARLQRELAEIESLSDAEVARLLQGGDVGQEPS